MRPVSDPLVARKRSRTARPGAAGIASRAQESRGNQRHLPQTAGQHTRRAVPFPLARRGRSSVVAARRPGTRLGARARGLRLHWRSGARGSSRLLKHLDSKRLGRHQPLQLLDAPEESTRPRRATKTAGFGALPGTARAEGAQRSVFAHATRGCIDFGLAPATRRRYARKNTAEQALAREARRLARAPLGDSDADSSSRSSAGGGAAVREPNADTGATAAGSALHEVGRFATGADSAVHARRCQARRE
jgi:hypothetical protein